MNIDKIVKECPKTWEECKQFLNMSMTYDYYFKDNHIVFNTNSQGIHIHFRELFDYFDSVGIVIVIHYSLVPDGFKAEYYNKDTKEYNTLVFRGCNTRSEAEYQAFEKAFELLERRINSQNLSKSRNG